MIPWFLTFPPDLSPCSFQWFQGSIPMPSFQVSHSEWLLCPCHRDPIGECESLGGGEWRIPIGPTLGDEWLEFKDSGDVRNEHHMKLQVWGFLMINQVVWQWKTYNFCFICRCSSYWNMGTCVMCRTILASQGKMSRHHEWFVSFEVCTSQLEVSQKRELANGS